MGVTGAADWWGGCGWFQYGFVVGGDGVLNVWATAVAKFYRVFIKNVVRVEFIWVIFGVGFREAF